jgi:hypothetical protein
MRLLLSALQLALGIRPVAETPSIHPICALCRLRRDNQCHSLCLRIPGKSKLTLLRTPLARSHARTQTHEQAPQKPWLMAAGGCPCQHHSPALQVPYPARRSIEARHQALRSRCGVSTPLGLGFLTLSRMTSHHLHAHLPQTSALQLTVVVSLSVALSVRVRTYVRTCVRACVRACVWKRLTRQRMRGMHLLDQAASSPRGRGTLSGSGPSCVSQG